jgi:prevent-host-death family protein
LLPRRQRDDQKGAEEARDQLPRLLEAAESGRSTVITRRGRPVAALVPTGDYLASVPLTPAAGSGGGLWGRNRPGQSASCAMNGAGSGQSDFPKNSLFKKQKPRHNGDKRSRSAERAAEKARRSDVANPNGDSAIENTRSREMNHFAALRISMG